MNVQESGVDIPGTEQRFFDDTPLETLPTDMRDARRLGVAAAGDHVWFNFRGTPCCARCGLVRSREGNRACRGKMPRVTTRS